MWVFASVRLRKVRTVGNSRQRSGFLGWDFRIPGWISERNFGVVWWSGKLEFWSRRKGGKHWKCWKTLDMKWKVFWRLEEWTCKK